MNPLDSNPLWLAAVAVSAVVVILFVVVAWLRRSRPGRPRALPEVLLDVSSISHAGPPQKGARLEFYGVPVRLAVVVVAPVGRHADLPPPDMLPGLMERLLPGLATVIADHKPLIRRWWAQLSSQGFSQAFFNLVRLPGDRGKGTPWCSIAGKLQVGDRSFLAGLVCCAGSPNGLGQVAVQHPGQWLDILRLRDE